MSRLASMVGLALAALVLAPQPALADWRDYMGKTLIVEVKAIGRTVTDVITARGGAPAEDRVTNTDCDSTYHIYVSGKGRLFMHMPRIDCVDTDPSTYDAAIGQIYDLTQTSGMADFGTYMPAVPYSVQFSGDEVTIDVPQWNYEWPGNGYVMTVSNGTGAYVTRVRFSADCELSTYYDGAYRMEYRSTTSSYYSLEDTQMTHRMETAACRVVEGFRVK